MLRCFGKSLCIYALGGELVPQFGRSRVQHGSGLPAAGAIGPIANVKIVNN